MAHTHERVGGGGGGPNPAHTHLPKWSPGPIDSASDDEIPDDGGGVRLDFNRVGNERNVSCSLQGVSKGVEVKSDGVGKGMEEEDKDMSKDTEKDTEKDMSLSKDMSMSASHTRMLSTSHSSPLALPPAPKSRPVPDSSAFVVVNRRRHHNDCGSAPGSPRLCPPTPVRTPTWAHQTADASPGAVRGLGSSKLLATDFEMMGEGDVGIPMVGGGLFGDVMGSLDDSLTNHSGSHHSGSLHNSSILTGLSPSHHGLSPTLPFKLSVHIPPPTPTPPQSKLNNSFSSLENQNQDDDKKYHKSKSTVMQPEAHLSPDGLKPPTFATDFHNLGQIGSGAFADVHKVACCDDGRKYAIKRNRRQFRGVRDKERAMAEVKVMIKLQEGGGNDYLLRFVRAWQEDGYFYEQTELCSRGNARHLLDAVSVDWLSARNKFPSLTRDLSDSGTAGRLLPELTCWKIMHDVAAGLSHIHEHGMIHMDIKPSNIFFKQEAQGVVCKIGDFGMSTRIGSEDDGLEGDSSYIGPELLTQDSKETSADMFSLGLTAYELAAGPTFEIPSEGDEWHRIRAGSAVALPAPRSHALKNLIKSLIAPNPSDRPTAAAVATQAVAGREADPFLSGYVMDVATFDLIREKQMREREARAARSRRFTPTAGSLLLSGDEYSRDSVRTPTPGSDSGFGMFFPGP